MCCHVSSCWTCVLVLAFVPCGAAAADVLVGGVADGFQGGPDRAQPSAEVTSLLPVTQDFDQTVGLNGGAPDSSVAHTFSNLPPDIVRATLTFRVRASNWPGVESDNVFLMFVDEVFGAPTCQDILDSIVWGRTFGSYAGGGCAFPAPDPGITGETVWSAPDESLISFDLSAMPLAGGGTVDLVPQLNLYGFLDFVVSDETAADFVRLTVCVAGGCPEDADCDNAVNINDLLFLLSVWGTADRVGDINGDGTVNIVDLLQLLAHWGPCPA